MRHFQNVILVMVNGHPINEGWRDAATFTHDTMILDNVKRIEVIRGPGSALYGANAFAGVINIITKEAEDVDGWELSARGGSYDTQQYNLLYGKTHNDLNVVFNYNYFNTHGYRDHIERDVTVSSSLLHLRRDARKEMMKSTMLPSTWNTRGSNLTADGLTGRGIYPLA